MIYVSLFARGMAAAFLVLPAGLLADTAPTGPAVLTVTGKIAETNADAAYVFDMEMLKALPETRISTSTIWTDGVQEFTGVELEDLMAIIDPQGETLKATAINDYAIEIPLSDAVDGGPVIAYLLNGEPMRVRDKGPLWIVYPYDQNVEYQTEVVYSRSIWQLDRIIVAD